MKYLPAVIVFVAIVAFANGGIREEACDREPLSRLVNDSDQYVQCDLRLRTRFLRVEIYPGDSTPCYPIVAWRCE